MRVFQRYVQKLCQFTFKVAFLQAYLLQKYAKVMRMEMDLHFQDTHEPIAHFAAIMNKYFNLSRPEASQLERVAKIVEQANPRYTCALEGRVFATVGELLQAAPEIERVALKEQNYRRPPPPHQLSPLVWDGKATTCLHTWSLPDHPEPRTGRIVGTSIKVMGRKTG